MYLQKRPSGGRGEYELAEAFGAYEVHDLLNHDLLVQLGGYGVHRTGVKVVQQGGKPRLRLIGDPPGIHLHRQVQAILLLPKPTRDETRLGLGSPVMRENEYVLRRIDVAGLTVVAAPPQASLDLGRLTVENGDSNVEDLNFTSRLQRIERVVTARNLYPPRVRDVLAEWDATLRDPSPLGAGAEARVTRLMAEVALQSSRMGLAYAAGEDVLPALEQVLGGPPPQVPRRLPPPTVIGRRLPTRRAAARPAGPAGPLPILGEVVALNSGVGGTLVIAEDLGAQGWAVAYRGNQPGMGYDLEAIKDGRTLRVEVKSSIGPTTPELTASEWEEAQKDGESYILAIVDNYGTPERKIVYVRNPALAPHSSRTVEVHRFPRGGLIPRQQGPDSL